MLKYLIAAVVIVASWLTWWLVEGLPAVGADRPGQRPGNPRGGRHHHLRHGSSPQRQRASSKTRLPNRHRSKWRAPAPIFRPELDEIRAEFEKAINALKSSKLGRGRRDALYILPWYLIIGPPGSGKTTALRNSGLEFPHLARRESWGARHRRDTEL